MSTITLHRISLSGHSHRVECFLQMLKLPYTAIEVDILGGDTRRPAFLALNPFGEAPVLQDGDVTLADSNAILVYLASRYGGARWWPTDPAALGHVQRWLSAAAGDLANGPGAARVAVLFGQKIDTAPMIARAHKLFGRMEQVLAGTPFLAGHEATLGDLANYGYTARAPEGFVPLDAYPNVRAWVARVEALPGFLPFPVTPIGLSAA